MRTSIVTTETIRAVALELAKPDTGLAFTPDVVFRLAHFDSIRQVKQALTKASLAGIVELQRDAGLSMSPIETSLCTLDTYGEARAWIRVI